MCFGPLGIVPRLLVQDILRYKMALQKNSIKLRTALPLDPRRLAGYFADVRRLLCACNLGLHLSMDFCWAYRQFNVRANHFDKRDQHALRRRGSLREK